jgi:hypothetical protein
MNDSDPTRNYTMIRTLLGAFRIEAIARIDGPAQSAERRYDCRRSGGGWCQISRPASRQTQENMNDSDPTRNYNAARDGDAPIRTRNLMRSRIQACSASSHRQSEEGIGLKRRRNVRLLTCSACETHKKMTPSAGADRTLHLDICLCLSRFGSCRRPATRLSSTAGARPNSRRRRAHRQARGI